VNLQQTRLDGRAALRLWGPADRVLGLLAAELGLSEAPLPRLPGLAVALVPYDAAGRLADGGGRLQRVDVRVGAAVRVPSGKENGF
jgi:hypothetical protein